MEGTNLKIYNKVVKILILGDNTSFHTYRWFKSYRESGFEVKAIGFEEGVSLCEGLQPIGKGRAKYVFSMPKLKTILKEFKPDLIHAQMAGNYGLMAYLTGKPYILSLWGPDIMETPFKSRAHGSIIGKILKKALLIHTDSQLARWFLEKKYGINSEKIKVFPFGISEVFFKKEIKKSSEEIVLISHRKLEKIYGYETILQALKILMEKGYKIKMYVASFGSEYEKLLKMSENLGLNNSVIFTGRVDEDRLSELLSQSHIFISASGTDTTPNSLLEAMALKAFPVMSDLPVYREWIVEGVNGYYFKLGDSEDLSNKLELAIKNLITLNDVLELNRKIVEELANWNNNFEKFKSEISKILGE